MQAKSRAAFPLILTLVLSLTSWACAGEQGEPEATAEAQAPSPRAQLAPAPRTALSELPEGAQAISFLGEPLLAPVPTDDLEAELMAAMVDLEADPGGAEALIWAGRRYAYLGEYRQAIDLFTRGMELHPADARFPRHRGHRYLTLREPELAIADFRRAAELIEGTEDEVEPDGRPNAMGIPTSTLHFNVWYHYGLAHYLLGEFEEAAEIYRRCMEASVHADSKVATAHWWYMSLRRLGRDDEARNLIQGMDLDALGLGIIESGGYLDFLRLYAGEGEAETGAIQDTLEGATAGYGYGHWFFYNGDTDRAREVFQAIVDVRGQWAAFGYIAAEAELARM